MAVAVPTQRRVEQQRTGVLQALGLPASILALVLAAGGQYALAVSRNEYRGGLLYAAALAAFAVACIAQARTGERAGSTAVAGRRVPARLLTALAAVTAHILAITLIVLDSPLWLLTAALGLLSLVLAVIAAAWQVPAALRSVPHAAATAGINFRLTERRAELLALGALLVLGGVLRMGNLENVPSGVHGDETEFGLIALQVLRGAGPNPFGTMFLGDPALFAYVGAPFVAAFGQTILALRLPAAISGTLTLLVCYLFVRDLFGMRVAWLATGLLTVSAVHIHFSRLGLNIAQIPLFAMLSAYLVWRAYQSDRAVWWLLAGIVAGSATYFHFSGRLLVPMVGAFMLYVLVRSRRPSRDWFRQVGLLALGATMALSPIVVHSLGQWHRLTEHVGGRLLWNQWDRVVAQHQTSDPIAIALLQMKVNLLAFLSRQDASEFYTFTGAPLNIGLIAPLVVLGLALVAARLRDPRYALVAIWFWPFVILAGALTFDSPQFHRLLPALPAALIGAALVVDWLVERWTHASARVDGWILVAVTAVLVLAAGTTDVASYFGPWARLNPWPEVTAQARSIAALGPSYQVFLAGRPFVFVEHGNTRYLAADVGPRNLGDLSELPAPPLDRPLAVIVNPGLSHYLPLLKELYPEHTVTVVERPAGRVALHQFVVAADRATDSWPAGQGLSFEVRPSGRERTLRGVDRVVASRLEKDRTPDGGRPFDATWRGQLVAPTSGRYQIELFTDGEVTLRLDGREIITSDATPERPGARTTALNLEAGPHPLQLDYRYERGPGTIELIWQPPDGQRSIVPPSALRP